VHTAHAGCPVSQAAAVVPVLQVPAVEQHSPLQAVSAAAPQEVEHCPSVVLHAMPVAQSLALVQPGPSALASIEASAAGASTLASRLESWLASMPASTPLSWPKDESGNVAPSPGKPASGPPVPPDGVDPKWHPAARARAT